MSTLVFALGLAAAVLISSVVNQMVRGVSMPLIQIGIGILLSFLGFTTTNFVIDPELFLTLFIAPLLYDEARSVDKVAMWSNRTKILSLAIALVLVTILVVGFTLNIVEPSIPLAAAFALGAALGPTDAVAVASVSQRASLTKEQESLLAGESLINDASGVVSFQFAIAAFTTGTFSLLDAAASFGVSFFGGIIVGLIIMVVISLLVAKVRDSGLEDTTFHVLVDVLTPFIIFIVCEALGVSGILAVVAAGLAYSFLNKDAGPNAARLKIVSGSVWRMLDFVLNGIVFVLLGLQLPTAMTATWEERSVSNPELIALMLLITATTIVVRALWFLVMDFSERKRRAREEQKNSGGAPDQVKRVMRSVKLVTKESFVNSLAMSLAGPKGAISLSIVFMLPYSLDAAGSPFSQRDFLIFLVGGVVLVTLLLANFALPILLPKQKGEFEDDVQASVDVLRAVIEDLASRQTRENRRETQEVVRQYNARIDSIKRKADGFEVDDSAMRMQVLRWREEYVLKAIDEEELSPLVGYRLLRRIHLSMSLVQRKRDVWWALGFLRRYASFVLRSVLRLFLDKKLFANALEDERIARDFHIREYEYALHRLQEHLTDDTFHTEYVSALMLEIQRDLRRLRRTMDNLESIDEVMRRENSVAEVRRTGYLLELEHIQKLLEDGHISRATAKNMRENVHMMQIDLEEKV